MGNGSERMIANGEDIRNRKLAEYIGLTYDEFSELEWRIDTEESNDGEIYNYIIYFSEDSPREILDKISDLGKNDSLWIASPIFENLSGPY